MGAPLDWDCCLGKCCIAVKQSCNLMPNRFGAFQQAEEADPQKTTMMTPPNQLAVDEQLWQADLDFRS
jgi:hypothetical protein